MRGRHTQRDPDNHKTWTPLGVLQTAHTLHSGEWSEWAVWTPQVLSWSTSRDTCNPRASTFFLFFFFLTTRHWKQTVIHPEPELCLRNYSGASQFTLMSAHAGFLAASFQDLMEPLALWELCSGSQMATVSQDEPPGPPDSCPFMACLLLLLLLLPHYSTTWRLLTTGAMSSAGWCCLFFPAQEFALLHIGLFCDENGCRTS